jgi:hypothetical protein
MKTSDLRRFLVAAARLLDVEKMAAVCRVVTGPIFSLGCI